MEIQASYLAKYERVSTLGSKEPRQVFSNFTQENADEQHSLRNAMKETHLEGSDRNTASPTESAVCERQGREHSGADCLNFAMWYHGRQIRHDTSVISKTRTVRDTR